MSCSFVKGGTKGTIETKETEKTAQYAIECLFRPFSLLCPFEEIMLNIYSRNSGLSDLSFRKDSHFLHQHWVEGNGLL